MQEVVGSSPTVSTITEGDADRSQRQREQLKYCSLLPFLPWLSPSFLFVPFGHWNNVTLGKTSLFRHFVPCEPYCLYHYGKLAFGRRHKEGTGSTVPFLYSRSFVLRFPFDCSMRILNWCEYCVRRLLKAFYSIGIHIDIRFDMSLKCATAQPQCMYLLHTYQVHKCAGIYHSCPYGSRLVETGTAKE